MKRIAIITTFVDIFEAFSLCGVVESQLRSLIDAGYDTTFVACDGFQMKGVYCSPDLKHFRIPNIQIEKDSFALEYPNEFKISVEKIKTKLRQAILQIDIAITHDIIYLPQHLAYNQACRELSLEFPEVRWLHWIHSAPEPHKDYPDNDPRSARFKKFPNGMLIYPNSYDLPRVSKQFSVDDNDINVVPHLMDFEKIFDFHELTMALIKKYDLYTPDVFAIYPIRMDRGKQPEKLVRLFSEIKKAGKTICLLIVNFHSTGQHFIDYREEILREAKALGLEDKEIIFSNKI